MDGEVSDNLGVFPLVRRLCAEIIVVDASFDSYLTFEYYGYLKQQLAKLDLDMDIPDLEVVAEGNRIPADPNNPEVPCDHGTGSLKVAGRHRQKWAQSGVFASGTQGRKPIVNR
jgi:hypothetical protein